MTILSPCTPARSIAEAVLGLIDDLHRGRSPSAHDALVDAYQTANTARMRARRVADRIRRDR